MRTLTEKYNAVLEGTFPKKQFVRDAKLSHPNFITQFTSYEDAVKILKNKGLVHENKKILKEFMLSDPEVAQLARGEKIRVSADRNALGVDGREIMLINPETDKYETHTISVRQLGNAVEISTTPAQGRKEQVTQESTRTYTGKQVSAMAKRAGDRVLDARDSLLELVIGYGDRIPKEEVLQVLSHYDLELKDVTGRGASNADTDYQIPSWLLETGTKKQKVSDTFPKTNLPLTALDKAIKYELEKAGVDYLMAAPDTDDYLKAKAKAEKALAKDRLYYLELKTSKKKRTDLMEPVTAKNVVDKGNEMKKVKTVRENIHNSAQMGGPFSSKGTAGYIDNPTPGTYSKEDAARDILWRITNQINLKYHREISAMRSEQLQQFLQQKGFPQQAIDSVIQGKEQASYTDLKEAMKTIIKKILTEN